MIGGASTTLGTAFEITFDGRLSAGRQQNPSQPSYTVGWALSDFRLCRTFGMLLVILPGHVLSC